MLGRNNYKITLTLFITLFFLITTPVIIGVSLFTLYSMKNSVSKDIDPTTARAKIFAALPDTSPSTTLKLIPSDARGEIVKNYLEKYESPLSPYSYYIVNVADEFGVDFRLLPAIARQESNLCKFVPPGTFNCWGWGIHSRGTLGFMSYEDGIKTVTEGLKKEYLNKGYTTPDEIMKKYTPLSDGSWANAVNQFILEME